MLMSRLFQVATVLAIGLLSCGENKDTLFTKLEPESTGIKFKNELFEDGPLNVANYIYFYNGGGVAVGDINNDGLQDILFTGNMVRNRLYLNKGNFKFEDITVKAGVDKLQGWCTGATMADVNRDGLLDIYICRSADINPEMRRNMLFINNGDLSFSEKAKEYGLDDIGYSTQSAFFDYDKDGDLDCFIINHSLQKYTAGVQDNPELRKEHHPDYSSKLYRNDNMKFKDVSDSAGITSNVLTFGLGIAVSDFNNDGWPDIMVSNDFNEPDYLFMNNRNGTFTEKLSQAMDHISLYSMGSDAADYNNDGFTDVITLDMLPEDNHTMKMHAGPENFDKFQFLFDQGFYYQYSRNMLQKNNGDGTFSEVGQQAGVSNTDWSWAALFGDYDNDGHKDLFVSNGYVKDYTEMDFLKYSVDRVVRTMAKDSTVDPIPEYLRKMPTIRIPNYIFRNNGQGGFEKKTEEWGFEDKGVSAGSAYADFDNDGDLDLVVSNSNDIASLYRNNGTEKLKNNYLRIQLKGEAGNERGVGAKVYVYSGGRMNFQEQSPVRGFQSSNDPVLLFGLGQQATADSVRIIWPDDRTQLLKAVAANQTLKAEQTQAKEKWNYITVSNTLFQSMPVAGAVHTENKFNDFTVQGLLPYYFSREGPCIAVGDVNADGRADFFQGGARGQSGALFLQDGKGQFARKDLAAFAADASFEDVAALLVDVDGDSDLDLYVASGGFEVSEGDPTLQDRLYLNDGKGNFSKSAEALPRMLSVKSTVKAADIDGDGDQDLFVGGRVVPGRYPSPARSYLLINDGKGKFTEEIQTRCPELKEAGMITEAVWLDINQDKQPDLVVAGEWMPVRIYLNTKGQLKESGGKMPMASNGWWTSMEAGDLDGDNDIDIVLGNCGTNTQFKVIPQEPMTLTYKDFDGNGSLDPVLCYFIKGVSYPAASRDDLTDQLPLLKKKYLEYKEYADATLEQIFTKEQLQDAITLKAETMQSGYLENKGAEGFVWHAFPGEAQVSPVHGIVIDDFNGDGKKDLLLGGNNTWSRIKFGRYTANHGIVLLGDGKGEFAYLPQWQSGLQLRGNLRTLVTVPVQGRSMVLAGFNDAPTQLLKTR